MSRKLNFELVPDGCWHSNLRYILPKGYWEKIKQISRKNANGKCKVCGKTTKFLDTHERWFFNEETKTQQLVDIVAVCKDCHSVMHIGFTSLKGNLERAENHYMKVNNCSYAEYKKELNLATINHARQNKVENWLLDISFLEKFLNEGK